MKIIKHFWGKFCWEWDQLQERQNSVEFDCNCWKNTTNLFYVDMSKMTFWCLPLVMVSDLASLYMVTEHEREARESSGTVTASEVGSSMWSSPIWVTGTIERKKCYMTSFYHCGLEVWQHRPGSRAKPCRSHYWIINLHGQECLE